MFHVKHRLGQAPTREQIAAAANSKLKDVIAPNLGVLFCGINPGLYSAAAGHHFARPGNRFWPTLYASGFTPRLFSPHEDTELLELGIGITNIASRTTARADLLRPEELLHGARSLRRKVLRHRPRVLAIVGLGAYRLAFANSKARPGLQVETVGRTLLWLLPNPSGLNAHHQPPALARLFAELNECVTRLKTCKTKDGSSTEDVDLGVDLDGDLDQDGNVDVHSTLDLARRPSCGRTPRRAARQNVGPGRGQ